MTRIRDISQKVATDTPVWPGEPPPELKTLAGISENCPVNVSLLALSTHTGSHADAPLHYTADGAASADCDLDPYIGPCQVVDVRHAEDKVTLTDFDMGCLEGAERLIFRTYERFPAQAWDERFTAIDAEVIAALGERGIVLVGTDAPSLDPQTSKTMDAHQQVRAHGMRILEGLVLDDIDAGRYELIALPLKLAGADASPVRAILREL